MITRREFAAGVVRMGALATAGNGVTVAQQKPRNNTLMHVGGDYHSILGGDIASKQNLEYNLRHGVKHLTAEMKNRPGEGWDIDELKRMKDNCDKYGVVLEAIRMDSGFIKRLRRGSERDREIDTIVDNIRMASQTGVKIMTYHLEIIPYRRNGKVPGRGGTTCDCFKLEDDWKSLPVGEAGRVTQDDYWERITYFLERVIPVATEYKIRMCCHPHDPGVPPEGYQGVVRVLGTVDGLKRLVAIRESPYHGLNFCQGTVSEMLNNPGAEIFDVIRYFGSRKKIVNVHFRNIRGRRDDFVEVFPDEGDVDFVKAIQVYKEVGYSGMLMPDHVPRAPNDPDGLQSFAFCYGYIRALIQAADATA